MNRQPLRPTPGIVGLLILLLLAAPAGRLSGAEPAGSEEFRTVMAEGIRLAGQGKLAPALARFRQAVRLNPRSARAHYRLALAYSDGGSYLAARDAAERATLLDKEFAPGWLLLGQAFFYLDDEEAAIDALKKALRLDPRSAHAAYILGRSYYYLGGDAREERQNKSVALDYFKQALALDPSYVEARFMEGCCFLDLEMPAAARDSFLVAIRGDPGHEEAYFRLGLCEVKTGRYLEAEKRFTQTLRHDPDHLEAHLFLADLFASKIPNRDLAERHYSRFLALAGPDHPDRPRVERMMGAARP